jgi:hypothetical protein
VRAGLLSRSFISRFHKRLSPLSGDKSRSELDPSDSCPCASIVRPPDCTGLGTKKLVSDSGSNRTDDEASSLMLSPGHRA